jgi:hypothetical protein
MHAPQAVLHCIYSQFYGSGSILPLGLDRFLEVPLPPVLYMLICVLCRHHRAALHRIYPRFCGSGGILSGDLDLMVLAVLALYKNGAFWNTNYMVALNRSPGHCESKDCKLWIFPPIVLNNLQSALELA